MFVRIKKSGNHKYLQVVHNNRIWGEVKQQVIGNMGRLDTYLQHDNIRNVILSLERIREKFRPKTPVKRRKKKAA